MVFNTDESCEVKSDTCMEIATCSEKFSDEIIVNISADSEDHCIIMLSGQTGRILRMMGVNVNAGKNQIRLDNIHTLESGIYQLSVKNKQSDILFSSILTKF